MPGYQVASPPPRVQPNAPGSRSRPKTRPGHPNPLDRGIPRPASPAPKPRSPPKTAPMRYRPRASPPVPPAPEAGASAPPARPPSGLMKPAPHSRLPSLGRCLAPHTALANPPIRVMPGVSPDGTAGAASSRPIPSGFWRIRRRTRISRISEEACTLHRAPGAAPPAATPHRLDVHSNTSTLFDRFTYLSRLRPSPGRCFLQAPSQRQNGAHAPRAVERTGRSATAARPGATKRAGLSLQEFCGPDPISSTAGRRSRSHTGPQPA